MDKGILNVVEKPRSLPTCLLHSHRIWLVSLKFKNLPYRFCLIVTSNFVEQNEVIAHKPTAGFKWYHIIFNSIPMFFTGSREPQLPDVCWKWRFRVLEKNLICSMRVSTLLYSAGKTYLDSILWNFQSDAKEAI